MILFYNGHIYSPNFPRATAMVIDHGQFLFLGSDEDLCNASLKYTKEINLDGKTIWPGLIDAHVHLGHLAENMAMVDCEADSVEICLNRIEQTASKLPQGAWIRGHGWNQNQWDSGYGNAAQLDRVSYGHPAYLTAKSLHAAWVNSEGMALAGIDSRTPDPPGGTIQRGEKEKPTGILFEAGGMQLIESIIPKPTHTERVHKIKTLISELWQMGLIGVHDFDDLSYWFALQNCYQDNELHFRVCKHVPLDGLDAFINAGLRSGYGDKFLNIGQVKLFADGALGPQTAAMKTAYENSREIGALLLTENEIVKIGKYATNHGLGLAIHAIGDLANHIVLNAFSKLRKYEAENYLPHFYHRIEHAQILDPTDLNRFRKLDIIASVQPVHAPSDMVMADRYLGERSKYAYAYQSLFESGAKVILGSDAPVEPINPFQGIHAAVTRQNIDGKPGSDGWHPEQKLTLTQALEGFSSRPAEISRNGSKLGRIQPGYKADFIILEQDPFNTIFSELHQIKPISTFVQGNPVFLSNAVDIDI
jgi:predicted amidohydrolase YtcJ